MTNTNQLQQYLDFYKSVMPGAPVTGMGYESAMNSANNAGNALRFALSMAGPNSEMGGRSQMPDYFAAASRGNPPGVTIGDNPYTPHARAMQNDPFASQPNRGAVTNYLARYLR